MVLSERFVELVNAPCPAIWVSNVDRQLKPDLVRLQGVKVEPDRRHVTLYIPMKYGRQVVENFKHSDKLAFLFADIDSNESYQLKGKYLRHRESNPAEIELQEKYIESFSKALQEQGLPRALIAQALYDQPSVAVLMQVQEIYEQTPRVGTGKKIPL